MVRLSPGQGTLSHTFSSVPSIEGGDKGRIAEQCQPVLFNARTPKSPSQARHLPHQPPLSLNRHEAETRSRPRRPRIPRNSRARRGRFRRGARSEPNRMRQGGSMSMRLCRAFREAPYLWCDLWRWCGERVLRGVSGRGGWRVVEAMGRKGIRSRLVRTALLFSSGAFLSVS